MVGSDSLSGKGVGDESEIELVRVSEGGGGGADRVKGGRGGRIWEDCCMRAGAEGGVENL